MMRILVLGGRGQFGRTAADQLRSLGLRVETASRSDAADVRFDANDPASLRAAMRRGDLVVDAAGPFHARNSALLEAALEIGFDVIDINDDLRYAETALALESRIDDAGVRVLSSASTVSAVAAAVVRQSGIAAPRRVTSFLAPASRRTANAGAALAVVRSLGRPVRVFHNGQLHTRTGWSDSRMFEMPPPLGMLRGRLFESADALYLPRIWPTLREVAMYVDPNTPGVAALLNAAARWSALRAVLEKQVHLATRFARAFGSSAGGVGYEIEDDSGRIARYAICSSQNSFVAAVAPAVLAARAIAEQRFPHRGLVPPDRHVEPGELLTFLQSAGLELRELD